MRSFIIISFLFLPFFYACSEPARDRADTTSTSENDADAARNFIRLVLDGKLDRARSFLYNDSLNIELFNAYERVYNTRTSTEDKIGYKNSSIKIYGVRPLNDTSSVVTYFNSYKKQLDSLRVIKENNEWKVDLRYLLTSGKK